MSFHNKVDTDKQNKKRWIKKDNNNPEFSNIQIFLAIHSCNFTEKNS